jgi:hypothetical protein
MGLAHDRSKLEDLVIVVMNLWTVGTFVTMKELYAYTNCQEKLFYFYLKGQVRGYHAALSVMLGLNVML